MRVSNLQATDVGDYTVVVSNSVGSVISAPATLTVDETPHEWTQTYSFDGGFGDGVAVAGPQGGVYLAGADWAVTDAGRNLDTFLVRYSATGAFLWSTQLGSTGDEVLQDITTDPSGNVFITGETTGDLAGPNVGSYDVFVAKFDTGGALLWKRQLGSDSADLANGICSDPQGNVILAGQMAGNFGGATHEGTYDMFVAKYDGNGALLWSVVGDASVYSIAKSVTSDTSGNIFVLWTALNHSRWLLTKYDPAGNSVWTQEVGEPLSAQLFGIAVAPTGVSSSLAASRGLPWWATSRSLTPPGTSSGRDSSPSPCP